MHTCGCISAHSRPPGESLAGQPSPPWPGSTALVAFAWPKPSLGRTRLPAPSVADGPETAPRAARARRPRGRGRRPVLRTSASGAERRGSSGAGRRQACVVTWGSRHGPTGRCGGRLGSPQQPLCGGLAAAWTPEGGSKRALTSQQRDSHKVGASSGGSHLCV